MAKQQTSSKSAQIRVMLNEGKDPATIAKSLGCTKGLVYQTRKRMNGAYTNKPVRTRTTTKRKATANAKQVGGSHYKDMKIQPWDAMEAWLTPDEFRGFLKGNIIKYMARSKSVTDQQKAAHYQQKLDEFNSK